MRRYFFLFIGLTSLILLACGMQSDGDTTNELHVFDLVRDEARLQKSLREKGLASHMASLIQETQGGSAFDCHQEAHTIGRIAYTVFQERAFQECDASCHSGCYHGAMETFLNEKGTANLSQNIDEICALFGTAFGKFECLHGVGHGVLAYLDYDMPEALKECGKLRDWFSRRSCYGGLFMENILTGQGLGADKDAHGTQWVNQTDPYFPCNANDQNEDIQYECYQIQTSWMLTMYNYDFVKVKEACEKAPIQYRSVCFKSFGRDASGNSLRNIQTIQERCNMVPREKDYYEQCITGAVNVIIDFWGPKLKHQATELCKLLTEPGKKTCYNTLASRLPEIFPEAGQRQTICNQFELPYNQTCL